MNNEKFLDLSMVTGMSSSILTEVTGTQNCTEPLRLTYRKPTLTHQETSLLLNLALRHKFIIYNVGNYTKEEILDAVMMACSSNTVFPVMYTREDSQKVTFVTKLNLVPVMSLLKHGLRIKMPDDRMLGIDIVLGYMIPKELDGSPCKEIMNALKTRYDSTKKILNLHDFKNDKALSCIYCSITSKPVFRYIICCCNQRTFGTFQESKLSIRELSLRSNGLTSLKPFIGYFNYHLMKLDLRNNAITDIGNLIYSNDYKITELWLDGNPLCSLYTTSADYVRAVKLYFPYLQKLDGVIIDVKTKVTPMMRTNYISDSSKINLIKQFVQHFFTFYDQNDRIVMNGLYDHDALFSITLGLINNLTHVQMTKAFANNRDLLKSVDYAKCHEFLLHGPKKIIAALRRQPVTYHNYKKFNIDVLHCNEDSVTIAIQGSFYYKEYPHAPLFFNRTFVILKMEDNEYCIANDQYHIQSEPTRAKNITVDTKVDPIVPKIVPAIFSSSEKQQLLSFLGERTTMNETYCRRYLEDANWDIRVAIEAFMKSYTVHDVPPEAFLNNIHTRECGTP